MMDSVNNFFTRVFGFKEVSYEETATEFLRLISGDRQNFDFGDRKIGVGQLSTPTLSESKEEFERLLKEFNSYKRVYGGNIAENISGDVGKMHLDNNGATIQAASQFNLLEHVSPNKGPNAGITCYIHDRTQGPVVAMAAAGGLAYRNYVVKIKK